MHTSAAFNPQQATYLDLLQRNLEFTSDELDLLSRNGFVVTDRLAFTEFRRAYAWIYWKDLPVLVTTDAILHAIHQTYDKMLKEVEMTILTHKLLELLTHVQDYVYLQLESDSLDSRLKPVYEDLKQYLLVPITLLKIGSFRSVIRISDDIPAPIHNWLQRIMNANDYSHSRSRELVIGIDEINLFNHSRQVDFSQFTARGHYDEPAELVHYFMAMMWFQLIDFRFVAYDPHPVLHREALVAALLLHDAIQQTGQRVTWDMIEQLLSAFVGLSDNITLNGFERLMDDAGVHQPAEFFALEEDKLLRLLTENDYGQQRIRGAMQSVYPDKPDVVPHHISFMLIGQRYTLESDIMQQLVYDKLDAPRAYPSPLDVMFVLGNDTAKSHLKAELEIYQYETAHKRLREWVGTHSHEFWQNTFYNLWLRAITMLGIDTTSSQFPLTIRSSAWADKMLQTQLSSWAQLRHDNILYAKPPYSPPCICEFPAGYVEPYPAFYAALREYAQFGRTVFQHVVLDDPGETLEDAQNRVHWGAWDTIRPQRAFHLRDVLLTYFDRLEATMNILECLANKELAGEPFSEEDTLFLRSIVVRKYVGETGYGGWTEEHWDGWYNALLPFSDQSARLTADIHTNYNSEIGEVGVLHIGTGDPVVMTFMVEHDGKPVLYVGPVFTYFEYLEKEMPPRRLLDYEWDHLLHRQVIDHKLSIPEWTSSFRVTSGSVRFLHLLDAYEDLKAAAHEDLRAHLDAIHDAYWEEPAQKRDYHSIGILIKVAQRHPQLPGISAQLMQDLRQLLQDKGYWDHPDYKITP